MSDRIDVLDGRLFGEGQPCFGCSPTHPHGLHLAYERQGDVRDVVFPCGWVLDPASGVVSVYYGCADTCLGLAHAQINELLEYILACPSPRP